MAPLELGLLVLALWVGGDRKLQAWANPTKPARAPLIPHRPFVVVWNAPTEPCRLRFKVDLDLRVFDIVANLNETLSGPNVTIFYHSHLGYYPYYAMSGEPINGGLPQNQSLSKHLSKARADIEKLIPHKDFRGLGVIDWENWRPQWVRNWGSKDIYRIKSKEQIRNLHPNWPDSKVEKEAKESFERAGQAFMNLTLGLAEGRRPEGLWGFYLFPDCYNYGYKQHPQRYTGECPNVEHIRNDHLMWLWKESTALYPSIYLDHELRSSPNTVKFVHHRVKEALRIASIARADFSLPVFVYSRPFYAYTFVVLSEVTSFSPSLLQANSRREEPRVRAGLSGSPVFQSDLVHTIGESAALGASGVVLWGSSEYARSQDDGRLLLLKPRMPAGPVGGASSSHHLVPVAPVCSWLLLLLHAASGHKAARLPLIGRKPFIAAWNAPLDRCTTRYNISTNVERLFHIQGSPRAEWTGQNITIFYANRLGFYPHYTPQGVAVNGGLPQNCSLDLHLLKAHQDIRRFIPARDVRGLAVIDWEFWRPQWKRNWHKKVIYRRRSKELTARAYGNVTEAQVEELARRRFEKSAKAFMQQTLQLGTRLRPNTLWGFYLYPDCHNYNLEQQNYTGLCPLLERRRNDELRWLWNSSSALFPSVAIRRDHSDSASNRHFSQHRIREALRVASLTSREYQLPTFVYLRLGYRDEALTFLSAKDLVHTIGESAALGAAGFVIWGDLNLTSSRLNCSRVRSFLRHRLGRYITNVTRAAEFCSDFLCQGNGRCVRRDPRAHHYLHLSGRSHRIRLSDDGAFAVSGGPSQQELRLLPRRFRCHCYEGHEGERCDSVNEVREDDGPWAEEAEDQDEQQRRRWEEEQDEGKGRSCSGAVSTGPGLELVALALLLLHLLTTTVQGW